jgi:hypothetical protein
MKRFGQTCGVARLVVCLLVAASASPALGQQLRLTGDVNGDGYMDEIFIRPNKGTRKPYTAEVMVRFGKTKTETAWTALDGGFSVREHWLTGDINGDGKDDLVCVYPGGDSGTTATVWAHLSNGKGYDGDKSISHRLGGDCWDSQQWMLGDFTGDGKADLVCVYEGPNKQTRVWAHPSVGNGFAADRAVFQTLPAGFGKGQQWLMADVNADGKDDLVLAYDGGPGHKATLWTHFSVGTGFQEDYSARRLGAPLRGSVTRLNDDVTQFLADHNYARLNRPEHLRSLPAETPATRVRVLIVGDTDDRSLGASVEDDIAKLRCLYREAADVVTVDVLTGADCTKERVLDYYHGLKTDRSEALVFHFSGHGGTDPRRGHFLNMRCSVLFRSDLRAAMQKHKTQLVAIFTDCCAGLAGLSVGVGHEFVVDARAPKLDRASFDRLFRMHRGTVDVTASDWERHRLAYSGYFTPTFCQVLRGKAGRFADWEGWMSEVELRCMRRGVWEWCDGKGATRYALWQRPKPFSLR